MLSSNNRARSNLAMLEFVARKLGKLKEEMVFLGGCATALLINDPIAPDVRTTMDVDCIIDVISLGHYHQLEKRLTQQGFKKSMEDGVICRWHYEDAILDVMPTEEKILGFGNRWYKSAIKNAVTEKIADDLFIQFVSAPYFLATKMEAFKARGHGDYLMSHDFEDIISVIDGRLNLVTEIQSVDIELKKYLKIELAKLLTDENFSSTLPGHLNYGSSTPARTKMVMNRIKEMIDVFNE